MTGVSCIYPFNLPIRSLKKWDGFWRMNINSHKFRKVVTPITTDAVQDLTLLIKKIIKNIGTQYTIDLKTSFFNIFVRTMIRRVCAYIGIFICISFPRGKLPLGLCQKWVSWTSTEKHHIDWHQTDWTGPPRGVSALEALKRLMQHWGEKISL